MTSGIRQYVATEDGESNYLICMRKKGELYIFYFEDVSAFECMRRIQEFAENDDLSLTMKDAEALIDRIVHRHDQQA